MYIGGVKLCVDDRFTRDNRFVVQVLGEDGMPHAGASRLLNSKAMSHGFRTQQEVILAIDSVLHSAHVQELIIMSAFPRPWTNWIKICAAVVQSYRDVLVSVNLTSSVRSDVDHIPVPTVAYQVEGVLYRLCVGSMMKDLAREGIDRFSLLYNFEVYTMDMIPFDKFRFLSLGFFVPYKNAGENENIFFKFVQRFLSGEYPNGCYVFSLLWEDTGDNMHPYDRKLASIGLKLQQESIGCCMKVEEGLMDVVWETIERNGHRISWNSVLPQPGYITLRIMASNDRIKGAPSVKKMDDNMKRLRRSPPDLVGFRRGH